jgi:hypothetical protein
MLTDMLRGAYAPGEIKYITAVSLDNAIYFSKVLTSLEIKHTIYLVCSRYGGSIQNIMNLSDFSALIKVNNSWIAFDDIFTQFHEIPVRFQGEEAITLHPEKIAETVTYTSGSSKIPVTVPAYNAASEKMEVSFDTTDISVLLINRTCSQTGAIRHDTQKKLLLTDDIERNFATLLVQDKKLEERLTNNRKSELTAAFASERTNQKTSFESEIIDHFNSKPQKIMAYEIMQPGLYSYNQPLEYKSVFTLESYVKKAGKDYIFEVGRLIGEKPTIHDRERNRSMDVYIPYPMISDWTIHINIPYGYDVKGVEAFNTNISNETGSLRCTTSKEEHSIDVKVTVMYSHNFEKASSWSKLLEIVDALYNISTQKILLTKSKP